MSPTVILNEPPPTPAAPRPSHSRVFVIHGDIRRIHADAYVIPGDYRFKVGWTWREVLGPDGTTFDVQPADPGGNAARRIAVSPPGVTPPAAAPSPAGAVPADSAAKASPCFFLADIGTTRDTPTDSAIRHVLNGVDGALDLALADLTAPTRQRGPGDRERPLLAMPLVGSRRGGFDKRKGALVRALIPHLEARVATLPFDVIVVCRSRSQYSAVQMTRQPATDVPPDLTAAAGRLAVHARSGALAVMFGAGASMPVGLPSWTRLLQTFGSEVGLSKLEALDPLDAASVIIGRMQPEEFTGLLQRELATSKHSLLLGLVASLRPRVAITTNYDDCYELAMGSVLDQERSPEAPAPSTQRRDRREQVAVMPWDRPTHPDQPRVLKLHGDVHRGSVVLSRSHFVEMHAHRRPLTALLQEHYLAGHVLAVATTLSDPTMAQAAEEVTSLLSSVTPDSGRPTKLGTWIQHTDHPARRALRRPSGRPQRRRGPRPARSGGRTAARCSARHRSVPRRTRPAIQRRPQLRH